MNKSPRSMRLKLGVNQTVFWSRVGVTQSAASRYENGREIPPPIATLLQIAYGTEKQSAAAVKRLRRAAY